MASSKRDGKAAKKETEEKYLSLRMQKMELSTRRLIELIERTQYRISQVNGQRTYGPPPCWNGDPPCKDCEVFVGRIPRDCFEDELIPVLERAGFIYEFRLMMDFSGSNRGFGFALYSKPEEARQAIMRLNHYEIRHGCTLGIVKSMNNCNLFIGGLDIDVSEEEIMGTLKLLTDGVSRVTFHLYKSNQPFQRQKKYALVEYETHRAAAMARRVLVPQKSRFRGIRVVVDWANPFGEDHKSDKNLLCAFPTKAKEKNISFDSKNKVMKNEEKYVLTRRNSLPPRHARLSQINHLSNDSDRENDRPETFVNIPTKIYQNPSVPLIPETGYPVVLQSKSPKYNPTSNNTFILPETSLIHQNLNHFVIVPQNIVLPNNFAMQHIIITAYQAQTFGYNQRNNTLQFSNLMKEVIDGEYNPSDDFNHEK